MAQRGDRSNGVLIQEDHDGMMAKVIHRTEDSDMIRLGNTKEELYHFQYERHFHHKPFGFSF